MMLTRGNAKKNEAMHVVGHSLGEQGRFSVHLSYSIQGCRAGFGEPSFGWRLQGMDLPMMNKTF